MLNQGDEPEVAGRGPTPELDTTAVPPGQSLSSSEDSNGESPAKIALLMALPHPPEIQSSSPGEPIDRVAASIVDPLEGHDSEFDVELSSRSSISSISMVTEFSEEQTAIGQQISSTTWATSPQLVSAEGQSGLYGKVVKTLRKFLHCVRHPLFSPIPSPSTATLPTTASASIRPHSLKKCEFECFGCATHQTKHQVQANGTDSLPTTDATTTASKIAAAIGSSGDVPFSPITSVNPDAPLPIPVSLSSMAEHQHKKLVIDLTYSKNLLGEPLELDMHKKCLVLDLDETLVHSSFQPVGDADLIVPVHLGEGLVQPIYVKKRPGVDEFLQKICDLFEVVIFTASLANYADPVIDFLDPRQAIRARLYRDSCIQFQGMYIKDLSRLGRDIERTLLVDNSPASFFWQPNNGLACRSWFSDPNDRELVDELLPLLANLAESPSVSHWRSVFLSA